MRKFAFSIFIITLLFTLQLNAATLVTLTSKQAVGGSLLKTNMNDSAAYFTSVSSVNDRIEWTLSDRLPSGLYQIDIDFYQPSGSAFSTNEYISFETTDGSQLGMLDFYYLGIGVGTYTKSIGFYTSKVLSNVVLIKSSQRNTNTAGIRAIRISVGTPATMANQQFVFQLPVKGTKVFLPMPLPAGSYIISAALPVATSWAVTIGATIKVPSSTSNRIYVDQPLHSISLLSGSVNNIVITHYPSAITSPDMSSAGTAPLMQTFDTKRIETCTLKLIGYTGKESPKLDLFPNGKKMAVVTSWDDGQLADIQLADTLANYGVKGTFMMIVSRSPMLSQMSSLEDKGMEIGSHSWSHPAFYTSSPKRCLDEAVESRRFLESKLGHPVISFAFPLDYKPAYDPNGDYVLAGLRAAGYWSARGTSTGFSANIDNMVEPLSMRPTCHFGVGAVALQSKINAMLQLPGSVFYMWGHSYELAGKGWDTLKDDLAVLANIPTAWYATLGELMIWQYTRNKLKIVSNANTIGDKIFTFKMPWLNPYLRKVPISLIVPMGVTDVEWQGIKYPVLNGRVQLMWGKDISTVTKRTFN